jgi:hypothetical protein
LYLDDVAAAPDGTVVIVSDTADGWDVRRARADGTAQLLLEMGSVTATREATPGHVAVLPDGAVLVTDPDGNRILRIANDGTRAVVAGTGVRGFAGDAGPASSSQLARPTRVAALASGGFAFFDSGNRRVRVVDPAGRIRTVARARRPGLLGAAADGSLFVQSIRHVIELHPDGRVESVIRDEGNVDPTTDGASVRNTALSHGADAAIELQDGTLVVLTNLVYDARLVALPPAGDGARLMVALPGSDRLTANRGRVAVRSTGRAQAHLDVVRARDRKTIARIRASLIPGRTLLHADLPRDGGVYQLNLTATTDTGQIASHRLTVIGGDSLSHATLRRLVGVIAYGENTAVTEESTTGCRRESRRRWRCRWSFLGAGHDLHGFSTYTLQPDGLIRYREHKARGGIFTDLRLEPPAA